MPTDQDAYDNQFLTFFIDTEGQPTKLLKSLVLHVLVAHQNLIQQGWEIRGNPEWAWNVLCEADGMGFDFARIEFFTRKISRSYALNLLRCLWGKANMQQASLERVCARSCSRNRKNPGKQIQKISDPFRS